MCRKELGELSWPERGGSCGCREGTEQGPRAHKGSYKSPAAQGPFSPWAGSILRAAVTQTCAEWGFAGCAPWPPNNSYPHLLLDEKKGLQVAFAFCRCFAFLSLRPQLTLPEEEVLQVPAMN